MLLTIFLKHRQSMNLGEINQKLEARVLEEISARRHRGDRPGGDAEAAEFYPTYDFAPIREGRRAGAGRLLERTRRLTRSAKKRPRRSGARVKVGIESATAANAVKFQNAPDAQGGL